MLGQNLIRTTTTKKQSQASPCPVRYSHIKRKRVLAGYCEKNPSSVVIPCFVSEVLILNKIFFHVIFNQAQYPKKYCNSSCLVIFWLETERGNKTSFLTRNLATSTPVSTRGEKLCGPYRQLELCVISVFGLLFHWAPGFLTDNQSPRFLDFVSF